jgi:hypothetical protein
MAFDYGLSSFIAFRDRAACERVRAIPRERLAEHPNPDFRIALVDEPGDFYTRFAADFVGRVRAARDEGRRFVAILLAPQTIRKDNIADTVIADDFASWDDVCVGKYATYCPEDR